MSNASASNTERYDVFMATLKAVRVYEFDGAYADNLNEMKNRHHAVVSALADLLDADTQAFSEVAGIQINLSKIGAQLMAAYDDSIEPEYREKREILRAEEAQSRAWGNAYDRSRQIYEERAA